MASCAVLDQVDDGLRDQAAIAGDDDRLLADLGLEGDVGARHLPVEHGGAHDFANVLLFHLRLGRAREGGELVHHARHVADLADDGVGAAVEGLAVLDDHLAVLAADALGRKLYRRQRVLDLVGDAPRHIGPGRGALRGDQLGDVVEGQHRAVVLLARRLARSRGRRSCARRR